MRPLLAASLVGVLLDAATAAGAVAEGASFRTLSLQASPRPYSTVSRISDDGTVITGSLFDRSCFFSTCFASNQQAFRQVGDGSLELLPFPVEMVSQFTSNPTAMTGDGSVVFGRCNVPGGDDGCRWQDGDVTRLGTGAAPIAASHDGSTLLVPGGLLRNGVITPLPQPAPETILGGRAITRDGTIVAGVVFGAPELEMAALAVGDEIVLLPDPPGLVRAEPKALSDDGRMVVGFAQDPGTGFRHAVVWRDGVPARLLQDEDYAAAGGLSSSEAIDVSGDGRIVLLRLGSGAAFLWDEANGLRRLTDVLGSDYRLDLQTFPGGPTAISRDGRLIVGGGAVLARGWVATLADACANGVDDDGDGLADLEDPGCRDARDYTERGPGAECDNGLDDDFDFVIDYPDDSSCASADQAVEGHCTDGFDNDGDGLVDFEDPGCVGADDRDEKHPTLPCDDGVDNDLDGSVDFSGSSGGDAGCASVYWPTESSECDDGFDNDGDGLTDWWSDPGCGEHPWGWSESGPSVCGLGIELLPVVAGLLTVRRARRWPLAAGPQRR